MKRLQTAILLSILVGTDPILAEVPAGPELGMAISAEELQSYEIGIMPNGDGLPDGSGSVKQGKQIYQQQCLVCHGERGIGNTGEQLAGAVNKLTDEWPEKTIGTYWPYATTLFDFTRRSMPMTQPGSLTNEQTYAVVAYMLYLNNLVDETAVMDADAIKNFQMPNRDGFIPIYELKQPE